MRESASHGGSITVKVHTILGLVAVIGGRDLEMALAPGSTLGDFLDGLSPLPFVRVMVNGRQAEFLEGPNTVLHEGDEILLLPPAAGG